MKTAYINGQIYTGTLPLVQAFSTEEGEFIAVGSNEDVTAQADQIVDLQGML